MGTTEYLEKEAFDEQHNVLLLQWLEHCACDSSTYTVYRVNTHSHDNLHHTVTHLCNKCTLECINNYRVTFATRQCAASLIPIFLFADVSNHARKPFSRQQSSSWLIFPRKPSFANSCQLFVSLTSVSWASKTVGTGFPLGSHIL